MLVLIDNYDSFTYNLVHYLQELGHQVKVVRNDETSIEALAALKPDGLVISPGPFGPEQAGISCEAIEYFAKKLPILGVCLGHQSIGHVFGAVVKHAKLPMHGKRSEIIHNGKGLFKSLPSPLNIVRYHSLCLANTLPSCLEVTATTLSEDGKPDEIMAIKHKRLPIYGLQFHPESIATEAGQTMLANWLTETGLEHTTSAASKEYAA